MTLLEQALAAERYPGGSSGKVSADELELILAWLQGQVTTHAFARVIKKSPGNVSTWAVARIRAAFDSRQLTFSQTP